MTNENDTNNKKIVEAKDSFEKTLNKYLLLAFTAYQDKKENSEIKKLENRF
ncbi:MAG: hypothetical protein V1716_02020 [Candidatus Uhrbacteria bacterium]